MRWITWVMSRRSRHVVSTTVTVEITFVSRHSRCLQCHSPSACAIMYHSSCLEILLNWSTTPDVTIADVENVGICTRILFEPPIRSRPTESISRGLLSPSTKGFLDPRVSQSLVMSLPIEIFHQLLDYNPPMPELIVLGQTDELIKHLRPHRRIPGHHFLGTFVR